MQKGLSKFLYCPKMALLRNGYGVVGYKKLGTSSYFKTGIHGNCTSIKGSASEGKGTKPWQ